MKNENLQKETEWLLKEKYNGKPNKKFYKDVKRLTVGEPVDYVIGFTNFLGCKIDLSKKPLIPRSETEFWVKKAIEDIKNRKPFDTVQGKILHILDIFSGSGCIGLAVLKNIKNSKVDFSDIDKNNLKQIKINLKINKSLIRAKKRRVIVRQSDVFKNIKSKYDYIFANPPYIAKDLRNRIQKSVLKYEPKPALFGGEDGMKYIDKFLKGAKKHLKEYGRIYMEFDPPQKEKIEKLLIKYKYQKWWFFKDQFDRWRWVVVFL